MTKCEHDDLSYNVSDERRIFSTVGRESHDQIAYCPNPKEIRVAMTVYASQESDPRRNRLKLRKKNKLSKYLNNHPDND